MSKPQLRKRNNNQKVAEFENTNKRRIKKSKLDESQKALNYAFSALGLFFAFVIIVGYLKISGTYFIVDQFEDAKSAENIATATALLRKVLQISRELEGIHNATINFRAQQSVVPFLKNKYKHAIDTISSLNALTKKYEDMKKRSSRPEQFIQSSLKKLEELLTQFAAELVGDEYQKLLRVDQELGKELQIKILNASKMNYFIPNAAYDPLLLKEKIFLDSQAVAATFDPGLQQVGEILPMAEFDMAAIIQAIEGIIPILEEKDHWLAALNSGQENGTDKATAHENLEILEKQKEEYLSGSKGQAMKSLLKIHGKLWQELVKECGYQADMRESPMGIVADVQKLQKRLMRL